MMIRLAEMIFCDVYTNFIEGCRDSRRRFETLKINSRDCDKSASSYAWSRTIWLMLRCSKSSDWSSWSLSFKSSWSFSIEKDSFRSTTISSNCITELTCSNSFVEVVRFCEVKRSRSFLLEFDMTTMISRRRDLYF